MADRPTPLLIDRVPRPAEIEAQLRQNLRENRLLRRLLNIAESAASLREQQHQTQETSP